jgi:lariat debranching enzyme
VPQQKEILFLKKKGEHLLFSLIAPNSRMEGEEVNVVCVGCTHGELDLIYAQVAHLEAQSGKQCHLVLCTGDFQATRDAADLASLGKWSLVL